MNIRPASAALLAVAALALGACQNLIPGATRDPPRLYELTPKSTFERDLPAMKVQLVIETPETAAGLQSARIAVKQKATTLDYFARAEWSDLSPRLVQTKMVESFENSGKIVAVGREGSGLRSDYILKSELRHFEAQLYEPETRRVHVAINLKLVKMPQREILANCSIVRTAKVKSDGIDDVILAFDAALGGAMRRIVGWTLRNMEQRERGVMQPKIACPQAGESDVD